MSFLIRLSLLYVLLASAGSGSAAAARGLLSRGNQTTVDSNGELQGTRSLPLFGPGYRSYSVLANALGRQYAHSEVIGALEGAFAKLREERGSVYKVAEIGRRRGGPLWPHVKHQEGLSVDIMTPMRTQGSHKPRHLRTGLWSRLGYCWHIDAQTHRLSGLSWDSHNKTNKSKWLCPRVQFRSRKEVDFDALKALLQELDAEARRRGGNIRIVIVSPSFVDSLEGVGVPLTSRAWIEHDDHIHVEFSFDTPKGTGA